jgi:hypothetical protein
MLSASFAFRFSNIFNSSSVCADAVKADSSLALFCITALVAINSACLAALLILAVLYSFKSWSYSDSLGGSGADGVLAGTSLFVCEAFIKPPISPANSVVACLIPLPSLNAPKGISATNSRLPVTAFLIHLPMFPPTELFVLVTPVSVCGCSVALLG